MPDHPLLPQIFTDFDSSGPTMCWSTAAITIFGRFSYFMIFGTYEISYLFGHLVIWWIEKGHYVLNPVYKMDKKPMEYCVSS